MYQFNHQIHIHLVLGVTISGWWLTYPSEKYEFVNWDHYSQYMEKKHVPNHQPASNMTSSIQSSMKDHRIYQSMDWFNGKFTGKPHIYWENLWFPVNFPIIQFYESVDSPFKNTLWIHQSEAPAIGKSPRNVDDFPMKTPIRGVMDFHGGSQIRKSRPKIAKKSCVEWFTNDTYILIHLQIL